MQQEADMSVRLEEITRRVQARLLAAQPRTGAPAPIAAQPPGMAGGAYCDTCAERHIGEAEAVPNLVAAASSPVAAGPAADLASCIDHTLLKPNATRADLQQLCAEAKRYGFATVCVNAANVRFCAAHLEGAATRPIAVVGFPLGAGTPAAKAFEAREAVDHGAAEIDMVLNLGALKSGCYIAVAEDISAVVRAAAPRPVKVILETGALDHEQKIIACTLAKLAGAAFVKTSTGFGPGGATVEDIALMRRVVGPTMGVKASGGVRTEAQIRAMLQAGANRIGASASVAIVSGQTATAGGSGSGGGGY